MHGEIGRSATGILHSHSVDLSLGAGHSVDLSLGVGHSVDLILGVGREKPKVEVFLEYLSLSSPSILLAL